MTITINRRFAALVALLLALATALAFAAYSYGESTRKSDDEVSSLVSGRVSAQR